MDFSKAKSEEDFNKAHTKAFINEIQHFLSPEEAKLISLNDVKHFTTSPSQFIFLSTPHTSSSSLSFFIMCDKTRPMKPL